MRLLARSLLVIVYTCALLADWIAPAGYADQFRENAGEPPSRRFLLGVDDLGRDRLSRLLHGSRISLLGAPSAAALATVLALAAGAVAAGRRVASRAMRLFIDVMLSLPLLLVLLIARAMLPLNARPWESAALTFLLLAVTGWPAAARLVAAAAETLAASTFLLQARASGCRLSRLLAGHLLPNLRPVAAAQFWILVPVFIIAEANLGILGLGVSEPLPSWGGLVAELTAGEALLETPWRLSPAFALISVVLCFRFAELGKEPSP